MLVHINNTKDDEEFNSHREYAYVYEYDDDYDDDQKYEEKSSTDIDTYEISYETCEEEYIVP
ncbi:hypothetical protein MNB_SM-4-1357 [hydrothermal vent metagenome]|uniref:Uncharacterized protein n=1 Tax=hydrothermal vent metagenome TaxID=652676 RepID=A0A1W1CQL9_9ZZZZ